MIVDIVWEGAKRWWGIRNSKLVNNIFIEKVMGPETWILDDES